jgi:hypothetical protein
VSLGTQQEREARTEIKLPDAVGLCPDPEHTGEFYMPLDLPLSSPLQRCPEPGCDKYLVIYGRAS